MTDAPNKPAPSVINANAIDAITRRHSALPQRDGEPVFAEPWHAQVFAMVVELHEKGHFEWTQWSATLGEEIERAQAAGDPDLGDTYYLHWLNALERILVDSKLAQTNELTDLQKRWHDAALHTPHGQPIVIDRTDRPQ